MPSAIAVLASAGRWDRALWVILARRWQPWRYALAIVQPATVIRWHREGFKRFWTRRSRAGSEGRPALGREIVGLIRKMSSSNVTWGAPRIRNELSKIGIEVAVSTVARYMVRQRKPSSPSWRAFLDNHVKDLVAIDFFAVPTAAFGVLFGFLVLAHDRRRVLHFNLTATGLCVGCWDGPTSYMWPTPGYARRRTWRTSLRSTGAS